MHIIDKQKHMETFRARLKSVNSDGLNIPKIPADYMLKHRGSLIGKHFKTLVQIMPLIVFDLVPKDVHDAWVIMGRLTVLLWHTEITDLDVYLVSFRTILRF